MHMHMHMHVHMHVHVHMHMHPCQTCICICTFICICISPRHAYRHAYRPPRHAYAYVVSLPDFTIFETPNQEIQGECICIWAPAGTGPTPWKHLSREHRARTHARTHATQTQTQTRNTTSRLGPLALSPPTSDISIYVYKYMSI